MTPLALAIWPGDFASSASHPGLLDPTDNQGPGEVAAVRKDAEVTAQYRFAETTAG